MFLLSLHLFKKEVSSVKTPYDISLYWLVYRDPYNGLVLIPI